jgi:hypothetical protein
MTSDQLIKRYKAAYLAVNKKSIQVSYYCGWYSIGVGLTSDRCRARELTRMCEVLEERLKKRDEKQVSNSDQ